MSVKITWYWGQGTYKICIHVIQNYIAKFLRLFLISTIASQRFTGENCLQCSERFSGNECSQCSERFTGENCLQCSERFTGENCSQCSVRFSGNECSQCSERFTGDNCSKSCSPTYIGEGQDCTEGNCNLAIDFLCDLILATYL